ncbi:ComEA family DNA-binding protein [Pedobacter cryoconitis]|uniref:DNA uptake protein ComE-like DNA-binding protein n=1 Tax=Pedobacter cryoconitis TaxID=188932 RepID=A0A7X0MIT7_9SPHI|nr:helix-hairpin-helix domain-containing protein [Pedobacter cryoconitis]MBB6500494.1 DNA uptake protein ComE-like DNA-binding protein [Pedobacter cryoconitis]
MRKWITAYFSFSKREYNGLLVLIFLLVLISMVPFLLEFFEPEQTSLDMERPAIQKLQLILAEKRKLHQIKKLDVKSELFDFDPNLIGMEEWQRLGFSAKQAAVLFRYRAKGGRFSKKEDLQKMYPVSPEMYHRLLPYIHIEKIAKPERRNFSGSYPVKEKMVLVPLNTADTLQLMEIKGVGPVFARRIFKYRQRLGGFYKKEQLMEVFGLDSLKYLEIRDQISLDDHALVRINLNTAMFDDLKNHPYLKYKQINAIIQFRKQHGNYGNIADLKKVAILSVETIERLAPYISFNHD